MHAGAGIDNTRRGGSVMARLADIANRHPRLLALALGVVSATGFEPLHFWPLALLAMGGFAVLLTRAGTWRQALWWGWLFGWAHFTFGNNWIATAFTHQAAMPAVLGWVAVPLLAVYLAVYPALAAAGAWAVARGRVAIMAPALGGCWIVTEWLRSWVFTGYAWNPFAMVLLGPFDRPGLAALAPWMGTYALSGLAVVLAAGFAMLLQRRRWVAAGAAAALVAAGMYLPTGVGREGTLDYTLVQPDLRQYRINEPIYYEANFRRLAQLSRAPSGQDGPRLVLWPESSIADFLEDGYPQRYYEGTTFLSSPVLARDRLARLIGADGMLLTGNTGLKIEGGRAVGAYNYVLAVDGAGQIRGRFAKSHLVPYGEYLPMRGILEPLGLSRLVPGAMDFLPGSGPDTMHLGQFGRIGVQICYEIVFSGQIVDRADRPDFIFNDSNDGWFGAFGPPQHLAQARMRAVEEGLPVLRSTTTGISAVIDARGVVRSYIPSNTMGRIDGKVPPAAPPTLFARLGNVLPLLWAIAILATALIASRRRAR